MARTAAWCNTFPHVLFGFHSAEVSRQGKHGLKYDYFDTLSLIFRFIDVL